MSILINTYGIAIEGKAVIPGTQVKSWRLREAYESARAKYESGKVKKLPGKVAPPILLKTFNKKNGEIYDSHQTGREGYIRPEKVRRVKAKGVRIGGKYMARSVYREQLEDKRQGSLL